MAPNMPQTTPLDYALRALQLILAIIVIGMTGYAINIFRGHPDTVHTPTGEFPAYHGVPDAWGFLVFCAAWTILSVIFRLLAGDSFARRSVVGYVRLGVEAVAVLSWLAGWVAVAVNVATRGDCESGERNSCREVVAACVVGAVEWVLFLATGWMTVRLVFGAGGVGGKGGVGV